MPHHYFAGESASDASCLLTSFRITADKRLIIGGAYATGGRENEKIFHHLSKAATNRFPFIKDVKLDYKWSGYLAITKSYLPHIFEITPDYLAAIGCNGRGIAMSTMMGKELADVLSSELLKKGSLLYSKTKLFTLYNFRNIGVGVNVAQNNLLDSMSV